MRNIIRELESVIYRENIYSPENQKLIKSYLKKLIIKCLNKNTACDLIDELYSICISEFEDGETNE